MTVLQAISFLAAHASTANALNLSDTRCPLLYKGIAKEEPATFFGSSKVFITVASCKEEFQLPYDRAKKIVQHYGFVSKTDEKITGTRREQVRQQMEGSFKVMNQCNNRECNAKFKTVLKAYREVAEEAVLTWQMTEQFHLKAEERLIIVKKRAAKKLARAKNFLESYVRSTETKQRFQNAAKQVMMLNRINKAFWANAGAAAARRQHLSSDDQALSEFYNIVHTSINMVLAGRDDSKYPHFREQYDETRELYQKKLTESGLEILSRFEEKYKPLEAAREEEFEALKEAVSLAAAKILDHDVRTTAAVAELDATHEATRKRLAEIQQNTEFSQDMEGRMEEQYNKLIEVDVMEELSTDDATTAEGQTENAETMTEATKDFLEDPGEVLSGMLTADVGFGDLLEGPSISTGVNLGGKLLINKGIDVVKDRAIHTGVGFLWQKKSKELKVAKQVACKEMFRALMDIERAGGDTEFGQANLLKAMAKFDDAQKAIAADESKRAEVEKQLELTIEYVRTFLTFILNVITKLSAVVDPTSPITWAVMAVLSMTPIGPLGPIVVLPIVALVSFGLSKLLGFLAKKLISRLKTTAVGQKVLSTSVGTVKLLTDGVGDMIQTGVQNALSTSLDFVGKKMSDLAGTISKKTSEALNEKFPGTMDYLKHVKDDGVAYYNRFVLMGKGMLMSTTKWARRLSSSAPTDEQLKKAITYEEDLAKSVEQPDKFAQRALAKLELLVPPEDADEVRRSYEAAKKVSNHPRGIAAAAAAA